MSKIPIKVIHHGRYHPLEHLGGVETFARNLGLVFEEVTFTTPSTLDPEQVERERLPVICDNQTVLDWHEGIPLIGFQHGVAAVKVTHTKSRTDRRLARDQAEASQRRGTLWVACAEWISHTFEQLHGNGAEHVVYHQVDVSRFDGRLTGEAPRLILHDARSEHKGKRLIRHLARTFPEWRFEGLSCEPQEVPDRMRKARAFLHLSRYEGNSIVCNEAMAMDLPCMFTRVGLMQDERGPSEVHVIDPVRAFDDQDYVAEQFRLFVASLDERELHPRRWVLENAGPEPNLAAWQRVIRSWQELSGWDAGI